MPKTRLKLAALASNRQRSEAAGREQADQAQRALKVLQESGDHAHQRWIDALQQRIDHPTYSLRKCGETMTPPLSKHQYSALLRRALLAADTLESQS
ncbi:hypothetical protein H7J87_12270 [Mycolicibacterium wolinskyi]|nr:helix-turn-helix domain-containing protein [Mycolicibacterium goodii]MCV7286105.1 hypothetical protein [Mycolicibacterium wolinskyi]MCV7296301.1 hypothetical protein [Mycolicibacterium goodii]